MQTLTQRLANPTRFMELSARVLPWVAGAAAVGHRLRALSQLLRRAARLPAGRDGAHHVHPRAVAPGWRWRCYALIAVSAFGLLVFRHPLADVSAKAAAPLGAAFTFLALVTGSLWGRPIWGTYWVWDARLTSVLILFFLYLGLMALRSSIEDESLAAKLTAILALVGIVMLPIIKFSVEFGNTLHQPASVIRAGGPTIDAALLTPLLVMARRLHADVRRHASEGDAQRDPAPPRQGAAARRGRAGAVRPTGGGGVGAWISASIWDRTRASSGRPTAWSCWWSARSSPGWSSTGASRSGASPISPRAASSAARPPRS